MSMHTNSYPRIVITGMGLVTALGSDAETFFGNLLEGKSGISRLTRFDTTNYNCKVAGEIPSFDPTQYMEPKDARRSDRFTQFAIAASKIAVKDSGIDFEKTDRDRAGVIIGSGIGGISTIEEQGRRLYASGPHKVSPLMIPMLIGNMAAGQVAIDFKLRGPNYCVMSACATGSHAIGDAVRMLRLGEADVMLAGGSEASITELGFAGFCNMKAMAAAYNDTPEKASRPFDAKRDGFVMGEGAGILILETEEHAIARGAHIHAEVIGHAATCDAYHITAPDPEGYALVKCMNNALADAGIRAEDVDYVNAHGTSTPYNDSSETKALKKVFGEYAHKLKISSTKSMTGHLLGAAGAVEAIASIKTIEKGWIAPTINYENPDPDCDLDYVPNVKVQKEVNIAMSNNMGFGGHNASVIFRRYGNK
jgi:3-oxoacyl-[acyl-carrier-protein] synthase II